MSAHPPTGCEGRLLAVCGGSTPTVLHLPSQTEEGGVVTIWNVNEIEPTENARDDVNDTSEQFSCDKLLTLCLSHEIPLAIKWLPYDPEARPAAAVEYLGFIAAITTANALVVIGVPKATGGMRNVVFSFPLSIRSLFAASPAYECPVVLRVSLPSPPRSLCLHRPTVVLVGLGGGVAVVAVDEGRIVQFIPNEDDTLVAASPFEYRIVGEVRCGMAC